ncbi:MAG: DUF2281 domain-containing protein, partial [Planctomycetaceae bacterium]
MTQQELLDEIESLPPEVQRQVADFIAFLRQRYRPARPARGRDLAKEPFVGMWRDRTDLEDSTAWVRSARKAEWG